MTARRYRLGLPDQRCKAHRLASRPETNPRVASDGDGGACGPLALYAGRHGNPDRPCKIPSSGPGVRPQGHTFWNLFLQRQRTSRGQRARSRMNGGHRQTKPTSGKRMELATALPRLRRAPTTWTTIRLQTDQFRLMEPAVPSLEFFLVEISPASTGDAHRILIASLWHSISAVFPAVLPQGAHHAPRNINHKIFTSFFI